MIIYGVALLSLCTLVGLYIGDVLGIWLGAQANIGGVGFAMLLLLFLTERLKRSGQFVPRSAQGVEFWSLMYIPIIVAMAANQNVLGAMKGGPMALLAGALATLASFALIPMLDRMGRKSDSVSREAVAGRTKESVM